MTSRPPDELLGPLSEHDPKVAELALALRSLVLKEAPESAEKVFVGYALAVWYSVTGRYADAFCHIVVYSRHVNLGFNRGAELEDPDGVLEGSGKIIRHIKIETPDDLKKPYLRRCIRAAVKHAKSIAARRPAARSTRSGRPTPSKNRPSK
jgi:hypothetical protein